MSIQFYKGREKMRTWKNAAILVMSLILFHCAKIKGPEISGTPAEENLKKQILKVLDSEETKNAFWGVSIKRLKDNEPFFIYNEGKSFMPASNMKLFTTASSLVFLGKDFKYETLIYHTGEIDANGVLQGSLAIQGSGDPSISGRYRQGITTEAILNEWCEALKGKGIKAIEGDIIGDDDYFTDREISGTWQYDNLSDWYTAPSSALSLNDNLYQFYVLPGAAVGDKAELELQLGTSYIRIQNDVITTATAARKRISFVREAEGNRVRVYGHIPLGGAKERVRGCVYNATLFSATLFRDALVAGGIAVKGKPRDIDEFDQKEKEGFRGQAKSLHVNMSPPLSEILPIINKPSQNYYADMLLKTLGKKFRGEGSFDAGEMVVKDFLRLAGAGGIDQFQMIDGSGLSRKNYVEPRQTVALLEYMVRSPDFPVFYNSLPIGGEDGTIKSRFTDPVVKGNIHAKTGFISNARSLSGYVDDRKGDRWVFCMMCNNWSISASDIDDMIDKVCIALAEFGGQGM